jgi:hypothetical protein
MGVSGLEVRKDFKGKRIEGDCRKRGLESQLGRVYGATTGRKRRPKGAPGHSTDQELDSYRPDMRRNATPGREMY